MEITNQEGSKGPIYNITGLEVEEISQIDLSLQERLLNLQQQSEGADYPDYIKESINTIKTILNAMKKAKKGK